MRKGVLMLVALMLVCGTVYAGVTDEALKLRTAGKTDEALVLLEKQANDMKLAPVDRVFARYAKAQTLAGWKKVYPQAIVEMEAVTTMPGNSSLIAWAYYHIGSYQEALGQKAKAQAAYIKACYASTPSVRAYEASLKRIDRAALGEAEYKKLLAALVLAVPATPENAAFLGYLKSEQEKFK